MLWNWELVLDFKTVTHLTSDVSLCVLKTSKVLLAYVFQSHEEDDRKVRRREKNRVAAQRSRKKQTQKADKLHEVNEYLMFCRHSLCAKLKTLLGLLKQAWAHLHTSSTQRAVGVWQTGVL